MLADRRLLAGAADLPHALVALQRVCRVLPCCLTFAFFHNGMIWWTPDARRRSRTFHRS